MVYRFYFLILVTTQLLSCQVYNSASNDQIQYSSDGTLFGDVKVIFSMKCTPCHTYYLQTEQSLKTAGVLAGGDIYSSAIYYRLKGVNAGAGNENMPSNGQLTEDELNQIKIWIESVSP